MDTTQSTEGEASGQTRRGLLKCMAWAGTGIVWTVSRRRAARPRARRPGARRRKQAGSALSRSATPISASRPRPTPTPNGTLQAALGQHRRPADPAGDDDPHRRRDPSVEAGGVRHRGRAAQGRQARHPLRSRRARRDRRRRQGASSTRFGAKGAAEGGWYSFDQGGVHFVGLVNVLGFTPGTGGTLGDAQLEWLEKDLKGKSASTPIVVLAHVPLWSIYPQWGWATADARQGAGLSEALRLGHRAQRAHPPGRAEGRGQRHAPHRDVDRLSAAGPRRGPVARPDEGRTADKLKSVLGVRRIDYAPSSGIGATDMTLA